MSLNTGTADAVVATADATTDSLYGVSLNGFRSGDSGPSSLYVIDEVTGAGELIGEIINGDIDYAVNSIAFDPTTGLMYASTTSWSGDFNGLLQIDPSTGAAAEIGAFGSEFRSILGLSFNSAGELFGWHDPSADDPVRIDKATGAATPIGDAGLSTGGHVMAFDNSDKLMLVQGGSVYEINTDTGAATLTETLPFNPGSGGGDINNTTGDLWASATMGRTQDSIIRVTDDEADTFTDIDTDVEYLNALAFGGTGDFQPAFPTVVVDLDFNFDFDTGIPAAATLAIKGDTTAVGTITDTTDGADVEAKTLGDGNPPATPGTETDPDADFEEKFYLDPELTTEITTVTLGGGNPASVDVYVKTFDNDPPFNEPDEDVKVELKNLTKLTINISDAADEAEGTALKYVVSLNGDTAVAVTAGLGFGAGTAEAGTDYEAKFYSDEDLSNEITSVMLGGVNPKSMELYVETLTDGFTPEVTKSVIVTVSDIQNANPGDTSGSGDIIDVPPPNDSDVPPPSGINDSTDTGPPESKSSKESGEEGEDKGEDEGEDEGKDGDDKGSPDPLAEGPADPAEEDTQKEAEKFEAEVEALIVEKDFSKTADPPGAGKPDAQQPQTRAEEVAEIISIMDKAAALVTQCSVSQSPFQ